MTLPHIDSNRQYTVRDIFQWDGRWELIEGTPYLTASPSRLNQTVSRRLLTALENFLKGENCEVFAAPFDVYLSENSNEDYDNFKNAVQPDLFIVCEPSKIHDRGVKGAPDWIAEIISPTTAKIDRLKKFNLYERFGITEYWLISPFEQSVEIFVIDQNKRYVRKGVYGPEDLITLHHFEEFELDVSSLFEGFPLSQ